LGWLALGLSWLSFDLELALLILVKQSLSEDVAVALP
jgi:hypothetical protein